MTDLQDLLKHEIKDLYSAEQQIIGFMPFVIEKVSNPQLREALERHLEITQGQVERLEQVQQLMAQGGGQQGAQGDNSLFARLSRKRSQGSEIGTGGEKCLGMEGLLKEGEKVLSEEMEPSVLDAAIIACAQKIEHYEICGYGTARAYARELNMGEVAELLEQTLDEEYEADDRLTDLAVQRINEEAEMGGTRRSSRGSASSAAGRSGSRSTATKSTSRSRAGAAVAASGSRSGSSSSSRGSSGASRSSAPASRGASSSRSTSSGRSAGRTKTAGKSSSSRGGSAAPAPASRTRSTRSTSKSTGRDSGSANTRSAAGSRSGKAPSKAAAAKGGRNSSGGGRTASKSTGRGSSSGRSAGRR